MLIAPATTGVTVQITFTDDGGLPLTGKVAADFPTVWYQKAGGNAKVAISLTDLALITSAWTSGGLKEIGDGDYRLDVPDAAFTTAARVKIKGEGTNKHVIDLILDVQYAQSDLRRTVGQTATLDANNLLNVNTDDWAGDNINAGATAGVPDVNIVDYLGGTPPALVGGRFDASVGAMAANVITAAAINASALNGKGDWLLASSYTVPPTAAAIATGVWQDATAGDFTTAGSIGKSLFTSGAVPGAAGGHFIAGSNAATTVNFTGSLSGSVGSVTGAVGSVTGNVGGNVTGSVGSISGITFPTNFGALLINASGHISRVTLVDTVTTLTGYTTPPTVAAIVTGIWTDLLAGSDFATSSSIGKLLKDDVDATISSRSTYAGADTSGTTTLLARLTAGRATNLDNLDASVATVSGQVGAVQSGLNTAQGSLNILTGMTENVGGDRWTTHALMQGPAGGGGSVAAAWDELKSAHTIPGSFGDYLDAKVSAAGGGTGTGDITVTHNYGGTDALRVLDNTANPVDGAVVYAYDSATYTSGTNPTPDAQTFTGSDGRWQSSLHLDAGSYKIVVSKPGTFQDKVLDLTVA